MTTATAPTIEAALADIEAQLTTLGDIGNVLQTGNAMEAYFAKRSALWNRRQTIQASTQTLAQVEPKITPEEKWEASLVKVLEQLTAEFNVLPPKIKTETDLHTMVNLRTSIRIVNEGKQCEGIWTRELETLRLGQLLIEAGYTQAPPVKNTNAAFGPIEWYGSLADVRERLKELRATRDQAQRDLDRALAE